MLTLSAALGTVAKAAGALASLGALVVVTGWSVTHQRLHADLLPKEALAVVPRDAIAAAGARELGISAIVAGVFALVAAGVMAVDVLGRKRLARLIEATIVIALILFVPWSQGGISSLVVGLAFLFVVRRSVPGAKGLEVGRRRVFAAFGASAETQALVTPLVAVATSCLVAVVVLSFSRQVDFPILFPRITVELKVPAGEVLEGSYIGLGDDAVLVGRQEPVRGGKQRPEKGTIVGVPRDSVQRLILSAPIEKPPGASSLLTRFLGRKVFCIPLDCQFGSQRWEPY